MNSRETFYMPAEWQQHKATIIEWPVKESMCWPQNYKEVIGGYASVVKSIAQFEPVVVIASENTKEEVYTYCGEMPSIVVIPHNDAWARDNGPTFVINNQNEITGLSWNFNAWGEKYFPYDLDNEVASKLIEHLNIPCIEVPIVLEGGSFHVDGEGTLLSTKQCLLNANRNPDLSREEIEEVIKKQLNISKIIWLNKGLYGDETDGHIDNIACFTKAGTVLIQTCYDEQDPNYYITKENLEILKNTKDAKGRSLEIIEIPNPPTRYYEGERLTLSYLNFYFVNGGIILPVFGEDAEETDKEAEAILRRVFPERKIIKVDGMSLIKEGGNVHCITQQIPEVISK
ncbi:agmatine deiminase family protein [Clostridium sp. DL1XJH146]